MPEVLKMNKEEQSLLTVLNWMEQSYENKVYVLDIDFKHGGVALFGEPSDTQKFREQLNEIMASVYEQVEPWRDL
jgi:hypothetical protein